MLIETHQCPWASLILQIMLLQFNILPRKTMIKLGWNILIWLLLDTAACITSQIQTKRLHNKCKRHASLSIWSGFAPKIYRIKHEKILENSGKMIQHMRSTQLLHLVTALTLRTFALSFPLYYLVIIFTNIISNSSKGKPISHSPTTWNFIYKG